MYIISISVLIMAIKVALSDCYKLNKIGFVETGLGQDAEA